MSEATKRMTIIARTIGVERKSLKRRAHSGSEFCAYRAMMSSRMNSSGSRDPTG